LMALGWSRSVTRIADAPTRVLSRAIGRAVETGNDEAGRPAANVEAAACGRPYGAAVPSGTVAVASRS